MNTKIRNSLLFSIIVIFILTGEGIFNFSSVNAAPDWLTGWSYRKGHIINAAAGAGTNYQIKITVHKSSGTDSGEDVYVGTNVRDDFGDVKFTDDNGITLLDYWMEDYTSGVEATFWVEVKDNLSSSNQTIYVYYGNSGATTTSNGADTFIFYEDWDSYNSWTDAENNGWVLDGTNVNKVATIEGSGDKYAKVISSGSNAIGNDAMIYYTISLPSSWEVVARVNEHFGLCNAGFGLVQNVSSLYWPCGHIRTGSNPEMKYTDSGDTIQTVIASLDSQDTWRTVKFQYNSMPRLRMYIDDNKDVDIADVTSTLGDKIAAWIGCSPSDVSYVNTIRIRNYVNPEPTHGSWFTSLLPGSPSSLGPTNYVNGSWISDNTPTLQFTQSDPDSSDTLKYRIQIDNNSNFSSPVVDYTSNLLSQGATSFTVGQAQGSGSYTQGSQGQTLSDGSYYWQVMSEDQRGETDSWTKANSGNIAFKISIGKLYTGVKNTVYSAGAVTYSGEPNTNNLIDFSITPSKGSIEVTIFYWFTLDTYYKKWKETASDPDITTTHVVGDLKPNTSYPVKVNGVLFGNYTSNSSGQISFVYDLGYSDKMFEVGEPPDLTPTGNNTSNLFYLLPIIFFLIGYSLLRKKKTNLLPLN